MPRKGGWRREGSRGSFRYVDARGNRITDEEKLERITSLVIPPAWNDVWISPNPAARL
jgi:DNA topoisomerase I